VGFIAADGAGIGVSDVEAGAAGEADVDAAGVAIEDDGVSPPDARHADVNSTAQHALHTLAQRRLIMRPLLAGAAPPPPPQHELRDGEVTRHESREKLGEI
jgi:hypothetical protein